MMTFVGKVTLMLRQRRKRETPNSIWEKDAVARLSGHSLSDLAICRFGPSALSESSLSKLWQPHQLRRLGL
jgi:hypothetical protein